MKPHNIHLVVGDFNARVGLDSHSIHPEVIGRHCFYGTTSNNGERLVDLCEEFQLRSAQNEIPPSEASSLDMDGNPGMIIHRTSPSPKTGTNSITRTIRKKPNERSKADRRPSPDDSMTGQNSNLVLHK